MTTRLATIQFIESKEIKSYLGSFGLADAPYPSHFLQVAICLFSFPAQLFSDSEKSKNL